MKFMPVMKPWMLGLMLVLTGLPLRAADTVNRGAAYKDAVTLYSDDAALPLAVKTTDTKTFPDSKLQRFSYASTNNQRIPALLFVPLSASPAKPAPCLLILHGLGGNKEMMSGLARYAATLGYASLIIDEYGQGERYLGGTKPKIDLTMITTGVQQTVVDARRGLDYLDTRPDIDHKRIGLIGFSLGAILGTVTAGVDTRVKATVLVSGGGGWGLILKSLSQRQTPVAGQNVAPPPGTNWDMVNAFLAAEDPLTFAPHIAPRALLMESGRQDTTIVPEAAAQLYEAARQAPGANVHIDWYDKAGHIPPPELIYPVIRQWLSKNL